MKDVTMYSWDYCPFCIRAKRLLDDKGIVFKEIKLDGRNAEMIALIEKTGMRTVPQIFVGDHFIGGFTELAEADRSGKLDQLLED
jgi:glutaredoxin 3